MVSASARAGAACYALWALLHLWVAWRTWQLGAAQADALVAARVQQNALLMLGASLAALYCALRWNWRNQPLGYWLNLWLVSYVDASYLALLVAPGLVPYGPGLIGPALWALALAFSSLGHWRRPAAPARAHQSPSASQGESPNHAIR